MVLAPAAPSEENDSLLARLSPGLRTLLHYVG